MILEKTSNIDLMNFKKNTMDLFISESILHIALIVVGS